MNATPQDGGGPEAIFYDGLSSRRRTVTLAFADALEIGEQGTVLAQWPYADIRRVDSASGVLRLSALSGPSLARLEIRDPQVAAAVRVRCPLLDEHTAEGRGVGRILGWSLAAAVSIVLMVLFAIPLAADRIAPLVPEAFERRLGEAAEVQLKTMFGDKVCAEPAGQRALERLIAQLGRPAAIRGEVRATVLSTSVPNALALPGGRIDVLSGLLAKADTPDELAGVLAHELGHLKRRDSTREIIQNGGSSFLLGLLFGDITGSGALIFASRTLISSAYSREAEQDADSFAIDVMKQLGRSPRGLGELLLRITGKEADKHLSILATHPLTEDRLARMKAVEIPESGPPLLTAEEWAALKAICSGTK